MFPHPEEVWPRPQEHFDATWADGDATHDDEEEDAGGGEKQGPRKYGGGSTRTGRPPDATSAAWLGRRAPSYRSKEMGEVVRSITMALPRHLPQTSQASEHVGVALARQVIEKVSTISSDCLNVVKAVNAPAHQALGAGKVYAGIILDAWSNPQNLKRVQEVRWVKAHRTEDGQEDDDTMRDIKGNRAADKLAGEAVKEHPQPGVDARAALDYYSRRAPYVAAAVAVALQMFPHKETDRLKRRERPTSKEEALRRKEHMWEYSEGTWRCAICGTWTKGGDMTKRQEAAACGGHVAHHEAERWSGLGHKIAVTDGPTGFAFCTRCGGWSSRRAHKLNCPCAPVTEAGDQALKRITKGKHPWRKRLRGGGEAPRTSVEVVASYVGETGSWKPQGATAGAVKRTLESSDGDPNNNKEIKRNTTDSPEGPDSLGGDGTAAGDARMSRNGAEGPTQQANEEAAATEPTLGHAGWSQDEEDPFGHGGGMDEASGEENVVGGGPPITGKRGSEATLEVGHRGKKARANDGQYDER